MSPPITIAGMAAGSADGATIMRGGVAVCIRGLPEATGKASGLPLDMATAVLCGCGAEAPDCGPASHAGQVQALAGTIGTLCYCGPDYAGQVHDAAALHAQP